MPQAEMQSKIQKRSTVNLHKDHGMDLFLCFIRRDPTALCVFIYPEINEGQLKKTKHWLMVLLVWFRILKNPRIKPVSGY